MNVALRQTAICVAVAGLLSCRDGAQPAPSATTPSISGVVTDVISGAAVAGVAVAIQGKTATTGSDGRYSITGLTAQQSTLTAQHQGHDNFSQNVTISGATSTNIAVTPSAVAAIAGTWRDNKPGSTALLVVSVDTIAETGQASLEVGGRKDSFGSAYSPTTMTETNHTRTSTVFGNITLKVTPAGLITGSVTNDPADPDVSRVDFTGTVTPTAITVTYTVRLTDGNVKTETRTLTK